MDLFWSLKSGVPTRKCDRPFTDTVEMTGDNISAIVTYGVDDDGALQLSRELYYPAIRTIPRVTHGTLRVVHGNGERQTFAVNGETVVECPDEVTFDGVLTVRSFDRARRVSFTRTVFPHTHDAVYVERTVIKNESDCPLTISTDDVNMRRLARCAEGVFTAEMTALPLTKTLAANETVVSDLFCSAFPHTATFPICDSAAALDGRRARVRELCDEKLIFTCADENLTAFFRLAKLRAAESICDTVCGPLHSPGGGPYYAAVWANDQAEYAGPLFGYMGYARAADASLRAYDLFSRFMGPDLYRIPSSIIDGGRDIWEGAGDRGDAAMYLYGCARFLLALGDRDLAAARFWTLCWCVDYCLSQKNTHGVIASDSDELEGRLPAGDANLCTSTLTYDGLKNAALIADMLGETALADAWRQEATALETAIEAFFGATVSGFDAYRYYDGNTVLRSWICMPLTAGIYRRAEATAAALLSDRLCRDDGILSAEGDKVLWDRSTLYAFRGLLQAGRAETVYPHLRRYVQCRLLGEHIPYAVEAYPEGNGRHLSAESALFCRLVTEGICGLNPAGWQKLQVRPAVPAALGGVTLQNLFYGGQALTLVITPQEGGYAVTLHHANGQVQHRTIPAGQAAIFELA